MHSGQVELFGQRGIEAVLLADVAIHLHPKDDVAIAKAPLLPGTRLIPECGGFSREPFRVNQLVPAGHKVAVRPIPGGHPVRRYGQVIGLAQRDILPGDHVHTHNLGLGNHDREIDLGAGEQPAAVDQEASARTFQGYRRPDGSVGTRNTIAVISTVNCSAHTCLEIARHFTPERLAPYPNVDGVIAFTYRASCSMQVGGPTYSLLQRTLAGMARHPNVGACLLVGLGCETNQAADLISNHRLAARDGQPVPTLSIQDQGGVRPTVEAGIAEIQKLLPQVAQLERGAQPISELTLAVQCGGSDGWSGVTANPVVGLVADSLVNAGGTVVLSETPEIYGAEHLLTHRAISPEVSRELLNKVRWWEEHTRRMGTRMDNNPTTGNRAGGLTTIYEKALGAVAKGGTTPLMAVYEYAEPVRARGLVFMDGPGYDPVAVTGQVAGGCNLVVFTTGRGSVFGFKPAPAIKVASNTGIYEHMRGDMDLNAGVVLEGAAIEQVADELFDLILAVASGRPTKSEAQGIGEAEFSPWHLGETL